MNDDLAPIILSCTAKHLELRIGDPTFLGWATVLAYAVSAVLAARAASRAALPTGSFHRVRRFWIAVAVLLGLLALNKQLDLQSILTEIGRCTAGSQGWYENRRNVQRDFIYTLAGIGALLAIFLFVYLGGTIRRVWPAVFGLLLVGGFVLLRAVSFHHVDRVLYLRLGDLRIVSLLELAGIIFIIWGALRSRS